ncbi:Lactobacillus shifted protein [Cyberlindnera fabianii]|uniref:Lactobacillus shifted protein n=1 Tax=Cyberlindnera fabianii TaxID=36022 RepID=A0A1V2LAJ4_CYBFA|nr:Lactobacillus shifted protein [Cyberlindnera fabianii]
MLKRHFTQSFKSLKSSVTTRGQAETLSTVLEQAPNRATPWSSSQAARKDVINHAKFLDRDLSLQPRPYAAIDLIAQQPVRFIDDRIAVCQVTSNHGQGHPKIYINLEPKRAHPCGYGLRLLWMSTE